MFAGDRDLLILEPNLFRDVGWLGQRLVAGVGDVAGSTLTLTSQDVDFIAAGVDAGHVVLVGGVAYEVVARLSATTATISRLRITTDDPVQPPTPVVGQAVEVYTFVPQIAMTHAQVLRLVGIEPESTDPEALVEADITNPEALTRLEALGALHLIYAAASSLSEPGSGLHARTQMYRDRFAQERRRVAALVDLDGDGLPDATRRPNLVQFVRA